MATFVGLKPIDIYTPSTTYGQSTTKADFTSALEFTRSRVAMFKSLLDLE